jgi:predicted ATPase
MPNPLRLTRVGLHRFKATHGPLEVPLRPFNVFVGRNGAGKSTLLEALQWIDTAVRSTVNVACDRYNGITDLINRREPQASERKSGRSGRMFTLETYLVAGSDRARYTCSIEDRLNQAHVSNEELALDPADAQPIWTNEEGDRVSPAGRVTTVDRLALARIDELLPAAPHRPVCGSDIAAFWQNAVFLRLEPTDLARGASLKRPSLAPLLDEVGATLPTLLAELDVDARQDLLDMLQSVLPDFHDIELLRVGRSGNYALRENFPEPASDPKSFTIPSWMLSEGTRRMTAIFALLAHRPGPSLLCIEEIENGLDPISVRKVLGHLKEASARGVQVILTTHSPWLLDDVDLEDVQVVRRVNGDTTCTRLQDDPASQNADPRVRPGGRYLDILES